MLNKIRFSTRPNLKNHLQYLIYSVLRDIESNLLDEYLNYNDSLILSTLMFIGEFLGGLVVYLNQKKFIKKNLFNINVQNKYINKKSFETKKNEKNTDKNTKIIFIIFCYAFFDYIQFILSINTPQFINVSVTIFSRLKGLLIIFDALFYYYDLRLPVLRHQLFCLIIIGSCLLIIIITELVFQEINIFLSYQQFIQIFFLSFIGQLIRTMIDSSEKYLFEYDNINPFYALLFEGFFGSLLSIAYD